ncbi:hypothetical protein KY284_010142 [Solanum tuberosum]|nr:hypothetical protein KY284_010142 [Solanum tuberosum]
MSGRPSKKRKKEQGETSKTGKLSKRGIEMSCSTCHNNGHNKRKCPLGASASSTSFTAGPSSRPPSGPAAAPISTQTAGPRATPNAPTGRGRGRLKGSTENGSVASRTRMVGMSVLHTQSGATIINPGMSSKRFRNVKSSAVVTRDLGHKPICGVKWKGKQVTTSS